MVLFGKVIILWQAYTKSENRNTEVERLRMRELNMKFPVSSRVNNDNCKRLSKSIPLAAFMKV